MFLNKDDAKTVAEEVEKTNNKNLMGKNGLHQKNK